VTHVPHIFIDADACPVKQEIYRVAWRHKLQVTLVANSVMSVPGSDSVELIVVGNNPDEADEWIAEHIGRNDIVVTRDIPLAARCMDKEAKALRPNGREFSESTIGDALARREILSHLRDQGVMTGGPAPFAKTDRSRFLQSLERVVQASLKDQRRAERGKPF
jgi:uncharacterized protein